ncbi:MAG TPA: hypothetical protein VNT79_04110 [Phycisphaerae bacterium]|nr:hypothetical protein [Phycisphaerae bacterium]
MSRLFLRLFALPVLLSPTIAIASGPSDLLKQAIKENERKDQTGPRPVDRTQQDRLTAEANQLVDEKEFKQAVALYERAYRLDPNNRATYARLLVAKRAAGVMTAQDREALTLLEEEQAAEVDQVLRRVRLQIIQARQASRAGDFGLASERVRNARDELNALPDTVDASPYERELSTLSNAIKRKTARATKDDREVKGSGSSLTVTRRGGRPLTLADVGDEDVGREQVVYEERDSDEGEDFDEWCDDAASHEVSDDYRYVESGEIIEVDDALYGEQAVHAYARELSRTVNRRRVQTFINNQVASLAHGPDVDLVYPHDWAEKTGHRAEYRDGIIHAGEPFDGADGETYQTVIYDLAELVHPVPNFYAAYPGTAREQRTQSLDRQYLRERSMIFNGWPEDLAAGLPLLHFFGGIDNNAVSTRTDPYETARIVETLNRFINSQNAVRSPATSTAEPD